jgi:thiamine pyrophosphokinase
MHGIETQGVLHRYKVDKDKTDLDLALLAAVKKGLMNFYGLQCRSRWREQKIR